MFGTRFTHAAGITPYFSFFFVFFPTADDEYVAFGFSGSDTEARMEGADVALLYMDAVQGYATDYNITAKSSVRALFL